MINYFFSHFNVVKTIKSYAIKRYFILSFEALKTLKTLRNLVTNGKKILYIYSTFLLKNYLFRKITIYNVFDYNPSLESY